MHNKAFPHLPHNSFMILIISQHHQLRICCSGHSMQDHLDPVCDTDMSVKKASNRRKSSKQANVGECIFYLYVVTLDCLIFEKKHFNLFLT